MTWPNYFYFGKEGRLVSGKESETDKELQVHFLSSHNPALLLSVS